MVLLLIIPLPKECPENTTLRIFSYEKPQKKHILRGPQSKPEDCRLAGNSRVTTHGGWEQRCDNSQKDHDAEAGSQSGPVGREVSTGEGKQVHEYGGNGRGASIGKPQQLTCVFLIGKISKNK